MKLQSIDSLLKSIKSINTTSYLTKKSLGIISRNTKIKLDIGLIPLFKTMINRRYKKVHKIEATIILMKILRFSK